MFYASYDPNKGGDNIRGFYPLNHPDVTKPSIQITQKQRDAIVKFPGHFRIEAGRLIQIKDTKKELQRRNLSNMRKEANARNQAPLEFDGHKYFVDSAFLGNLNLNLNLCSLDKNHACFLWRQASDGKWHFVEHDSQTLVELAKAFNSRREKISRELYGLADN